jgi:hypothetical protein
MRVLYRGHTDPYTLELHRAYYKWWTCSWWWYRTDWGFKVGPVSAVWIRGDWPDRLELHWLGVRGWVLW